MAGSSSLYAGGGIPGLQLRAWVLYDYSAGQILKAFNVSAVNRSSAGQYSLTLAAAMADTNYILDVKSFFKSSTSATYAMFWAGNGAGSTSLVPFQLFNENKVMADFDRFWIGVYG